MLDPKNIKPIPKYILEKIKIADKKYTRNLSSSVLRFYSYLTKIKGELVKITVAVKHYKKGWYYKQVAVHGITSEKCFVRDLEYQYMGFGFRVCWFNEGIQRFKRSYWCDWAAAKHKYYNPFSTLINKNYLASLPEFKYCGYQYLRHMELIKYLRLWQKYPQVEYLLKLGFYDFLSSVQILRLVAKDKQFCRWLISNKHEFTSNKYHIEAIIRSYKTGAPLAQIQSDIHTRFELIKTYNCTNVYALFKHELSKFGDYIRTQKTDYRSYQDYLIACNYLGLDMTIPKNRYPHDFKRWHDIRIDEYKTKQALQDKIERAEHYQKFETIAKKFMPLQKIGRGYAVIIAASIDDLKVEGDALSHCVGKMNYDQRVIKQESLVFFVRKIGALDTPFVTVEYSLKSKKVLQCYGKNSQKPDEKIVQFVHNNWLKHANKMIKEVA